MALVLVHCTVIRLLPAIEEGVGLSEVEAAAGRVSEPVVAGTVCSILGIKVKTRGGFGSICILRGQGLALKCGRSRRRPARLFDRAKQREAAGIAISLVKYK